MTALEHARLQAVEQFLSTQRVFAYSDLLAEFVDGQGWDRPELNAAIDALAESGAIDIDGHDGEIVVTAAVPKLAAVA